jgi:adenine phosphoribosyltransferase
MCLSPVFLGHGFSTRVLNLVSIRRRHGLKTRATNGGIGGWGWRRLQSAAMAEESLKRLIRDIPDFPKPGILFRDITPLLADPSGLALAVELLANPFRGKNIDLVVGAESRGFIFGTAVACCLSAGFVIVRKPGKLPHKKVSKTYDLEYGKDTLEMHADAIVKGQRVLIVDDVLATGGTMKACCDLVEHLDGEIVGVAVLTELLGLAGRAKVMPHKVHSVLKYE